MRHRVFSALLLSLSAVALLAAGGSKDKPPRGVVSRSAVGSAVERVTTRIAWRTSLEEALDQARREDKLVFWIQMLGRLDGVT
jgi:hypothetical protein